MHNITQNYGISIDNLHGGDESMQNKTRIRSFTITCKLSDSTASNIESKLKERGVMNISITDDGTEKCLHIIISNIINRPHLRMKILLESLFSANAKNNR